MDFKDLNIKPSYESGIDDIVEDFYEPVLSCSCSYDRISGFFTSSSLAVAARGMAKFITNGGKMRLITSPVLNPTDYDIMKQVVSGKNVGLGAFGIDIDRLPSEFVSNHVKALGWMLANNRLEIKLAIVIGENGALYTKDALFSQGLFHQKVGILTDQNGNRLSFSGSINETASAWINNDEEFKVFKEWDANEYFKNDIERFDNLWNGDKSNLKIIDLPSAVKNELISFSKDFDIDSISIKKYKHEKASRSEFEQTGISLFYYQKEALQEWKKNSFKMLFEMATGTGKTRTAVAALSYMMSKHKRLVTVISCPQNTLARQWKDNEVEPLGVKAHISKIIDGTNRKWVSDLENMLLKNSVGFADHCIIYTSHNTASDDKFIKTLYNRIDKNTKILFIGDEVHWLGAKSFRKALLDIYDYRIGLSATPSRWFDDKGTMILADYFDNNHFEFGLSKALSEVNPLTGKHFLVNYYYNIRKTSLTDDEGEQYAYLTEKISKLYRMKDNDPDAEESYNRLLEKRADIVKDAENKYIVLDEILSELEDSNSIDNTIIFVSPRQKDRVKAILFEHNIPFHQLTQEEGTIPEEKYGGKSERQHIIDCFKTQKYKVLIAIKCLDEGIDIPTATKGILMASSTNPREYVQRIGRIIRQSNDKPFAYIYDICIDSVKTILGEAAIVERKIRQNEQRRLKEIAENAINSADALGKILEMN